MGILLVWSIFNLCMISCDELLMQECFKKSKSLLCDPCYLSYMKHSFYVLCKHFIKPTFVFIEQQILYVRLWVYSWLEKISNCFLRTLEKSFEYHLPFVKIFASGFLLVLLYWKMRLFAKACLNLLEVENSCIRHLPFFLILVKSYLLLLGFIEKTSIGPWEFMLKKSHIACIQQK